MDLPWSVQQPEEGDEICPVVRSDEKEAVPFEQAFDVVRPQHLV